MRDVAPILAHDSRRGRGCSTTTLLDLARDTAEFGPVTEIPEGRTPFCWWSYADDADHGREQVAGLTADRVPSAMPAGTPAEDAPSSDSRRSLPKP